MPPPEITEDKERKRTQITAEMFDKFTVDEKFKYLLENDSMVEDIVMNWGQRFASMQDENNLKLTEIQQSHKEMTDSLKSIASFVKDATTVIFGDGKLEYVGVLKKYTDLDKRVAGIEDKLKTVVLAKDFYLIKDAIDKEIGVVSIQATAVSTRVKWTTRIVWGAITGGIIFIAWLTDKILQLYEIFKNAHPH